MLSKTEVLIILEHIFLLYQLIYTPSKIKSHLVPALN